MKIWHLLVLIISVLWAETVFAAPATIATSSSTSATSSSAQRKTFYDTVNGKHWAFWYDGTAISFAYSPDNSSWTAPQAPAISTLAYNTPNFSLSYKVISETGYVFLAVESDSYDIKVSNGTVGTSSISFGTPVTVFDGSSAADKYTRPNIALSQSNYIWTGAVHDNGVSYWAKVRRSTAVGDVSSWESAQVVGMASNARSDLVLMPQSSSNMFLLMNSDSSHLVAYAYNGSSWSQQNTGGDYSWFHFGATANSDIMAVAISGDNVYVGGAFTKVGGVENTSYIARWDGMAWNPLGKGMNNYVNHLATDGSTIYAAGSFTTAGGVAISGGIAKWNGTAWAGMGSGVNNTVNALAISGSDVYVGGNFTTAGGVADTRYIARWNGSSWNALGSGMDNPVSSLALSGSDVYAGGYFTTAGGVANTN